MHVVKIRKENQTLVYPVINQIFLPDLLPNLRFSLKNTTVSEAKVEEQVVN